MENAKEFTGILRNNSRASVKTTLISHKENGGWERDYASPCSYNFENENFSILTVNLLEEKGERNIFKIHKKNLEGEKICKVVATEYDWKMDFRAKIIYLCEVIEITYEKTFKLKLLEILLPSKNNCVDKNGIA